jgi:Ser-Thr-rich glycosyl-phosphatidyl-inositol-anchored membrane family
MRRFSALCFLVAFSPLAFADVEFTVPAAGASVAGGTEFTVTWTDSGAAPSISDLTAYQLFLESGSNSAPQQLYEFTLTNGGLFSAGNTITVTVPAGTGGTGTNA